MDAPQLARMRDLPFQVEATLPGRALRVSHLLNLKAGSLISIPRPAGETVDVFAGNVYIGSAELRVVNGRHVMRMLRLAGKS